MMSPPCTINVSVLSTWNMKSSDGVGILSPFLKLDSQYFAGRFVTKSLSVSRSKINHLLHRDYQSSILFCFVTVATFLMLNIDSEKNLKMIRPTRKDGHSPASQSSPSLLPSHCVKQSPVYLSLATVEVR